MYHIFTLYLFISFTANSAHMRRWTGSAVIQIMACRLDGAKPLSESMMTYYLLDTKEHISEKSYLQSKYFHSRECAWCRLRNGGHFYQWEMSKSTYVTRFEMHYYPIAHYTQFSVQYNALWRRILCAYSYHRQFTLLFVILLMYTQEKKYHKFWWKNAIWLPVMSTTSNSNDKALVHEK